MNRFVPLLASMLMAASLAGCAGGEDPSTSTSTTSTTAGPDGTATSATTSQAGTSSATTTAAAANTPPTGTFAASVQKGHLPLNVTFTLKGEDADGDELTWALDFGDKTTVAKSNATSTFPATVKHAYTKAGNYTATLTLSDGTDEAVQKLPINVTVAVVPPKPETEMSCTTVTGFGAGGVNGQVLGQGGCSMGRIATPQVVTRLDFPTGCRSYFNEGTDATTDGEAQVGTTYPANTDFGMYCDFGAVNPVGKIMVRDP